MRDYGKLYCGFWTSADTQSMSDDAKLLAAYLLTCHHSTIIGCFRLPDGYISDDLGWSIERVSKGFIELFEKGFATRDNSSKWVVINKYVKWNQPENPNQLKAAVKAFSQVPDECGVKQVLARSLAEFCNGFDVEILKPFLNPIETVSKPVVVVVTETVTEIKTSCASSDDESADDEKPDEEKTYSKAFITFWEMYPKKKSKGDAAKAFAKIKAAEYPAVREGLKAAIASADWRKDNGQFIPHPGTWLRARGWEDEYSSTANKPDRAAEIMAKYPQGTTPAKMSLEDQRELLRLHSERLAA